MTKIFEGELYSKKIAKTHSFVFPKNIQQQIDKNKLYKVTVESISN